MSQVVDFMFNNISRIGQDEYNYTQDNIFNKSHSNYMLTNLNRVNDVKAAEFVANHPTMNMRSSMTVGPKGYNIDESSDLIKSKLTNLNCKISLQERSYKSIPYLGRGNVDVGLENSLRLGETLKEKKSCSQLNESCYKDLDEYPLYGELRESLSDPRQLIEESAVRGWVRGGLPSREIYKNKNYQCN